MSKLDAAFFVCVLSFLQRVYVRQCFWFASFVFATRLCIYSAFMYLVVFCVFAVRLLNAAHELSNYGRFLNLLVFCLFACVFLICGAFAHVGHRTLLLNHLSFRFLCYSSWLGGQVFLLSIKPWLQELGGQSFVCSDGGWEELKRLAGCLHELLTGTCDSCPLTHSFTPMSSI